jgi:tetratricopeptide (TPR) repeat protein
MTDHKIQRRPGGPELLAPRAERTPDLVGVELLNAHAPAVGDEANLYRASAVIRAGGAGEAVDVLERELAARPHPSALPYLDLARAQISRRKFTATEATITQLLERDPDQPLALEWLAIARLGQEDPDGALRLLEQVLATGEARTDAYFNYSRLLASKGLLADALAQIERAVELRPTFTEAHFQRARSLEATGRRAEAITELHRTLALEPDHAGAAALLSAIQESEE